MPIPYTPPTAVPGPDPAPAGGEAVLPEATRSTTTRKPARKPAPGKGEADKTPSTKKPPKKPAKPKPAADKDGDDKPAKKPSAKPAKKPAVDKDASSKPKPKPSAKPKPAKKPASGKDGDDKPAKKPAAKPKPAKKPAADKDKPKPAKKPAAKPKPAKKPADDRHPATMKERLRWLLEQDLLKFADEVYQKVELDAGKRRLLELVGTLVLGGLGMMGATSAVPPASAGIGLATLSTILLKVGEEYFKLGPEGRKELRAGVNWVKSGFTLKAVDEA